MKKLIVVIIIVITNSIQIFAGPIVSVHFEIGRKSLGCDKFGICKMGVDVDWKLSTMQFDNETKMLQISIAKEMISGKEEYFKGKTVTFEELVVFSADVQKALGVKNRMAIEPGTYTLTKTRSGYQINIPIKK